VCVLASNRSEGDQVSARRITRTLRQLRSLDADLLAALPVGIVRRTAMFQGGCKLVIRAVSVCRFQLPVKVRNDGRADCDGMQVRCPRAALRSESGRAHCQGKNRGNEDEKACLHFVGTSIDVQ
jgi:hypothetical protein